MTQRKFRFQKRILLARLPSVETRYIALIPARGGSKGVVRKNLQKVGGKTLLERAIMSATNASSVESCIVSSDDEEILSLALSAGAVAHRRADHASTDLSRASEVVTDFIGYRDDLSEDAVIVYLQPTSPFRTSEIVEQAVRVFEDSPFQSLVSVVDVFQHFEKTLNVAQNGLLAQASETSDPGQNRQELPVRVYPNGAIYIFTVGAFRRSGDIPVIGSLPFMMGKVESIDIDDSEDLMIARAVADSDGI